MGDHFVVTDTRHLQSPAEDTSSRCFPHLTQPVFFVLVIFCMSRHALCLTDETLEQFSSLYSENNSIQLTRAERAMFFTSLVVQPESLMLRVCSTR